MRKWCVENYIAGLWGCIKSEVYTVIVWLTIIKRNFYEFNYVENGMYTAIMLV